MRRETRRWLRALRVLVACAVLALSARPAAAAVTVDSIALVAEGRAAPASAAAPRHRSTVDRAPCAERAAPFAVPRAADLDRAFQPEPLRTSRLFVLVERRYLRNCALLC